MMNQTINAINNDLDYLKSEFEKAKNKIFEKLLKADNNSEDYQNSMIELNNLIIEYKNIRNNINLLKEESKKIKEYRNSLENLFLQPS